MYLLLSASNQLCFIRAIRVIRGSSFWEARATTMLFHTWVFAVFFAIVFPVYLLVRRDNRLMNLWLMLASYTFYGWWNPWYLFLLFGTSAIDYLMVVLMERKQSTRKLWLIISLVSNFGFLGYFKYSGFITDNCNELLAQLGFS